MNVQIAAVSSSTPVSTESTRAVTVFNQVYEKLGDDSDQVVDIENLAYSREDCVKSPSNSGRATDNASRGNSIIYYDITHIPGQL